MGGMIRTSFQSFLPTRFAKHKTRNADRVRVRGVPSGGEEPRSAGRRKEVAEHAVRSSSSCQSGVLR